MAKCAFCGEKVGFLPFNCKYCKKSFCPKHRLPENHECSYKKKPKISVTTIDKKQEKRKKVKIKGLKPLKSKVVKDIEGRRRIQFEREYLSMILVVLIATFSILAFYYPAQFCVFLLQLFPAQPIPGWIIFTVPFVSYTFGFTSFFFLILLLFFGYPFIKEVEFDRGPLVLIFTFIGCGIIELGGTLAIILMAAEEPDLYSLIMIINFPFGMATGAVYGVISCEALLNRNDKVDIYGKFKITGGSLVILLLIIRPLLSGIELSFSLPSHYVAVFIGWYFYDLLGILGGLIFGGLISS